MNRKKINPESVQDVIILYKNLIPLAVITKLFDASTATVLKCIPVGLKHDNEDFLETGNKRKLELLKLYAWLVVDEQECSLNMGTPTIAKAKPLLYRHLNLKEWERYLEGVIAYKNMSQMNVFSEEISDGFKELIEHIFPAPKVAISSKDSLEEALTLMHKEVLPFPSEEIMNYPGKVLTQYVGHALFVNKRENRFFDQKFMLHLHMSMQRIMETRRYEAILACFSLSTLTVNDVCQKYDVAPERLQTWKRKAIEIIQKMHEKQYGTLDQTPGEYVVLKDSFNHVTTELSQLSITTERKINHLTEDRAILAEYIKSNKGGVIAEKALNIVTQLLPGEELSEERKTQTQILDTPIEELDLSVRCFNGLKSKRLNTLGDVVRCTEEELMDIRQFGQKSLAELEQVLLERNLHFGMRF